MALPKCESKDFFVKPKLIKTCHKNGTTDVYVREQTIHLPKWPGMLIYLTLGKNLLHQSKVN